MPIWTHLVLLCGELAAVIAILAPILKKFKQTAERFEKINEGIKCELRTEMLRIYYKHREDRVIRQYELEDFMLAYDAYKALGGNSFIDKIYEEVTSWEVVT